MNDNFEDSLRNFYTNIFPADLFFKWLAKKDEDIFSKREFSFTLKDDVYIRYLSFKNDKELRDELIRKNPYKIDIGAIFNMPPNTSKTFMSKFLVPESRELVFDIDITDYDDVRKCCSKADVCQKCWTLMTVAIKVLNRTLTEDFGFKHIMWVFSGRRGIHCWVSDEDVKILDVNQRSQLLAFISRHKQGKIKINVNKKWNEEIHPMLKSSIDICKMHFKKFALEDQKLLECPDGIKYILDALPNNLMNIRESYKMLWDEEKSDSSHSRWKKFSSTILEENHDSALSQIYLQILYPRLDINVTKGVNHLLKAPFCVHPKTGKICVPIDIDLVDEFDPATSPTLTEIIQQRQTLGNEFTIEKSCLSSALKVFQKFVNGILNE